MSKLSDSNCYGKITIMKKIFRSKVIWIDENALEVTVSAYDGDLWCQVMPLQVQSYSRHFQHLLSHIYMHQFYSKEKKEENNKKKKEKRRTY